MNRNNAIRMLLTGMVFLMAACGSRTPEAATPTAVDANAIFTAAAQTANVRLTEISALTPSPMPATNTPQPTPTTAPTQTPSTPTIAPTTSGSSTGGPDVAVYVADVTIPDGTDFAPGAQFVKTWRIKNGGTTTWTTAYALVFISGEQMGGSAQVALTKSVAPGETVDISVNLTAPTTAGSYTGYWKMRNANSQYFETSIYVQIDVTGSGTPSATAGTGTPVATATSTSGSAPTATTSSGSQVTGVIMDVDHTTFTGTCPNIFVFTAQFTLSSNATVTYKLEANTGYTITLPPEKTEPLDAGVHTVIYQLELNSSTNGWARFHVTSPVDVSSSRVDFSLTCQ